MTHPGTLAANTPAVIQLRGDLVPDTSSHEQLDAACIDAIRNRYR